MGDFSWNGVNVRPALKKSFRLPRQDTSWHKGTAMKIAESQLTFESKHFATQKKRAYESLRIFRRSVNQTVQALDIRSPPKPSALRRTSTENFAKRVSSDESTPSFSTPLVSPGTMASTPNPRWGKYADCVSICA
jgi:deoxyribodipyrimidine photolyase